MKSLLILGTLLFSIVSQAEINCIDEAAKEVLLKISAELNVNADELKVRYVGGESLDGDLDHDNVYKDHMYEYFDVFLKSENTATAKALELYMVEIFQYTDNDTGEVFECENNEVGSVNSDSWDNIYRLYPVR